jgi:hypothetical protein
MRRALVFEVGTCCFTCGCPRSICPERARGAIKTECPHGKVLMDAVFAASHLESVRIAVNKSLPQERVMELKEFWTTLGRKCMWEGRSSSRMTLVAVAAAELLGLDRLYLETGYVL